MDQTLLDGSFKGTGRAPNSSVSQVPDGANPRIGSPKQRGKILGRNEKNKASEKAIEAKTIYSTRPSPHVKKRRERYLMNRSRNTHPYSSSSIVDAYSNKNRKKGNLSRRRISSKQQRLKDSRLAQSKRQIKSTHNRPTSKPNSSGRTKFRKNAKVEPGSQKATKSKKKLEKKRKKRKKINQSQLILDRSAAPDYHHHQHVFGMLKPRLKPGQTTMAATGKCIAYLHPSLANRRLVAGRWNALLPLAPG